MSTAKSAKSSKSPQSPKSAAKPFVAAKQAARSLARPASKAVSKSSRKADVGQPEKAASKASGKPAISKPTIPPAPKSSAVKPSPAAPAKRLAPWDMPGKVEVARVPPKSKQVAAAEGSSPGSPDATAPNPRASKQAAILQLLQGPGATIGQMMQSTGWQAHSVRGMLSGVIRKRLGFDVQCSRGPDGVRTYRITGAASAQASNGSVATSAAAAAA